MKRLFLNVLKCKDNVIKKAPRAAICAQFSFKQ